MRIWSNSGRSDSLGVTRYQWPRTMAASEPPVTPTGCPVGPRRGRCRRGSVPSQRPRREGRGARYETRSSDDQLPPAAQREDVDHTQKGKVTEPDSAQQVDVRRGGLDHQLGGVRQPQVGCEGQSGEDRHEDRGGGEVAAGGVRPLRGDRDECEGADRQRGEDDPIDVRQRVGDGRGGHARECTGDWPQTEWRAQERSSSSRTGAISSIDSTVIGSSTSWTWEMPTSA